jgi:hypothetical protein
MRAVADSRTLKDLASYLATRVPEPPARVLAAGWPAPARQRLPLCGRDLRWVRDLAGLADGPRGAFDAALWHAGRIAEEEVAAARRALAGDGTLIAVVPGTGPGPPRRRGGLPAKEEELLRHVVHRLSEGGFAILREDQLQGAEPGDGWTVLQARPDPFVLRSYRAGDEAAILELFPACFHVARSEDHWRWKYRENPWGSLKISMAFSPEGELAAHYASYPVPFWRRDRGTTLALQMGDTMTSPAFRRAGAGRSGLLVRTVRHFFALHRDGTHGFYYGFNTGPIQRFCLWCIGGSQISDVGYWIRSLETAPGWDPGGYRVERFTEVGPAWDRFFERAAPHYGFLVRRDARWLDWRYLRCPDADFVLLAARRWGRLAGWCVFRRREDRLVWGDALFHPRHAGAAEPILAAALEVPELAGARRLEAWFPDRPGWWRQRLPALGLAEETHPDGLGMVALADADGDAIDKLGELYYTMGDGDLF